MPIGQAVTVVNKSGVIIKNVSGDSMSRHYRSKY